MNVDLIELIVVTTGLIDDIACLFGCLTIVHVVDTIHPPTDGHENTVCGILRGRKTVSHRFFLCMRCFGSFLHDAAAAAAPSMIFFIRQRIPWRRYF